MRIEARESKYFNFSTGSVKHCDYCKSSPALLYCKVESAFTCIACDTRAHDGSNLTHERVWICEVCEHAPAAFTCKADAAALCVSCDRDIHSANPLASRHERVPVVPFYDTAESALPVKPTAVDCNNNSHDNNNLSVYCGDVSNDSWMMNDATHHSNKFNGDHTDLKSLEFLFSSSDQLLDFDNYQDPPYLSDSVVPVQADVKPTIAAAQLTKTNDHYLSETRRFEIDFARSKVNSFNNHSYVTNTTTPSHSLSVSSSSMDVGVVPDGSSISDISNYPFGQNMNLTTSGGNQGLNNMDREARVLRYKEKRKNRKFEKTIRYASRKAYAESRPRIKGRFAKRTDSKSELDRIFSGDFIADSRYGVVPSF